MCTAGPLALRAQGAPDIYTSEYENSPQVDPYYAEQYRQAAQAEQEKFRKHVLVEQAVVDDAPTVASTKMANELKARPPLPPLPWWLRGLLMGGVILLSSWLVVRRFFPEAVAQFKDSLASWNALPVSVRDETTDVRMEAQAVAEFQMALRVGPVARASSAVTLPPLEEFRARWPATLAGLRKLLAAIPRVSDAQAGRRILLDLGRELQSLKNQDGVADLLPVWQMVCALEGLVQQLAGRLSEVTPSTLRTASGGLDLLDELCGAENEAQLLTRRPVRLLAVDPDPISRHAIFYALQQALHVPDLAADTGTGLALAGQHVYDVVFIDVERPDLDGPELCTQIQQTSTNRITPVVWVTGGDDFDARVRSGLSGRCDLIAKPFSTFELTVKALTMALRRRLQERQAAQRAPVLPSPEAPQVRLDPMGETNWAGVTPDGVSSLPAADVSLLSAGQPTDPVAPARDSVEIATEFLTRAPDHLGWMNEMLRSASKVMDEAAWLPVLADVYLRLHSFTPDEKFARGHPAMQLSSGLERLLRKLLQDMTPPSKATLLTITRATELLHELCNGAVPAFVQSAPIRLLVVDDDPVARRALTGALQNTFEKPVCAENGAAALALAAERVFDAIFLDVRMPDMDGFEVFSRLRFEGRNTETPVVFLCGRNDPGTTAEVKVRGDCDLVVKPFLTSELLVKALTMMLRRQQMQTAANT
ncbi:MAG: response regulator [Verrucomicrobiota bacterium]